MDDHPAQMAECVGDDVALAALDLLGGVEPARPAAFGGLDVLAVDDAGRRACVPAFQFTRRRDEVVADRLQDPTVALVVKVVLDGREGREVSGQQRPRAATRRQYKIAFTTSRKSVVR